MKIYIFQSAKGWGRGTTLNEAIKNYTKANKDRIKPKEIQYFVSIFEAKNEEDVWVDIFNYHTQNGAKLIA